MDYLRLMARFNRWANARFYEQVETLTDAEYRLDRGVFFGSIHNTLNHLLLVDRLWVARINGAESDIRSLDQVLYDNFYDLRAARVDEDGLLVRLVEGFCEGDTQREFTYRSLSKGTEHKARVDQVMATLFNHQAHHRGQVHAMLTQAGVIPPDLDVIDYLDEAEPEERVR